MTVQHTIEVGGQHYVAATSSRLDDRTRTLKHGDSFAVFDRFGDIQSIGHGEQGIYHNDTRYLSKLELRLADGRRPVLLNSTIKEDNSLLTVDLTCPEIYDQDKIMTGQDTIHIFRAKLLWNDVCHEHLRLKNFGDTTTELSFEFEFDADFADIFEVRGAKREKKGQPLSPENFGQTVILGYKGLDGVVRRTHIEFSHPNATLSANKIHFSTTLKPLQEEHFYLTICCEEGHNSANPARYENALEGAYCSLDEFRSNDCHVFTSNEQFNTWLNRSAADLHLLISDTPHGPYPYAGTPWFSTPFGRDGIITALQYLWVNPKVGMGVLSYLAETQATTLDPGNDAEPGKILHETRKGEMAALGEVPFAQYYGTIDATPLFIVLAGAYYQRTGDSDFIDSIWPNIEAALEWIDTYGDRDNDGFIEYERQTPRGLSQQGWKDSDDSIFHADGTPAEGAIALCEVQGYVYDAWLHAADLSSMRGDSKLAKYLLEKADRLKKNFNKSFWCEELGTYAIALDGDKNPCRVRSSNAGHTLYSGIAHPDHAKRITETLLSDDSFSGWGIRTIADKEARFNPMSYHNGAIWPHDNALIALGCARYGLQQASNKIITGLYDASMFLDLHRMPELFCGFDRLPGAGPTLYPVACAPQAWASTVAFACLKACLGISISGTHPPRINFHNPLLPSFLSEVELRNVRIGDNSIDILIRRYEHDVGVMVTKRTGNIEVSIVK